MPDSDTDAAWATVARETFEYNVVPWAGRKYAHWVRAWARDHPRDPRGLVQIPAELYGAFQRKVPGQRMSRQGAAALGYPRVPGEQELERVRQELHEALGRGDWDAAHDLDEQLRALQDRVAAVRLSALNQHQSLGA